jgi:hypothetical protein
MKAYAEKLESPESLAIQLLDHKRAAQAERDVKTIKRILPVGTIVRVRLGNALVNVRVTGHGCSWALPFEVVGVNTATGKPRAFHAACDFSVIEKPAAKKGGRK